MICCGNEFHSITCLDKALARVEELEEELAEARATAEQYRADWYAAKNEFGTAMAKMRDRAQTAIALEDAVLRHREIVASWADGRTAWLNVCRADDVVNAAFAASRAAREARKRIYPCERCGALRSKAEGGTTFTVCDACWDKPRKP